MTLEAQGSTVCQLLQKLFNFRMRINLVRRFKLKEISEYNLAKLTISYRSVDILWDIFDFVEGR